MELSVLVAAQEVLLAALILFTIPSAHNTGWQGLGVHVCQPSQATGHVPVSSAAWDTLSGFAWMGVSCLFGYLLGIYTSKLGLSAPQYVAASTAADSAGAYHLQSKIVQYYQHASLLLCTATAAAAQVCAEKLALLASRAAQAAHSAQKAAEATTAADVSQRHGSNMLVCEQALKRTSGDWAAVGAVSATSSELVALSGAAVVCGSSSDSLAVYRPHEFSLRFEDSDASAALAYDRQQHNSSGTMHHQVAAAAGSSALYASYSAYASQQSAAAPVSLQINQHRSFLQAAYQQQRQPQHVTFASVQQEQQQELGMLHSQQQQQPQQLQQREPLPPASPVQNEHATVDHHHLQQLSHSASKRSTAVTPLGCGWVCVLSCSSPDDDNLLQLQLPQTWRYGIVCRTMQQQGVPGEDISLSVVLGAGVHGKVYKGQWRCQPVAVKILYHTGSMAAAKVAEEAAIMLQAKHDNVIQSHHVLMWQRSKSSSSHANVAAQLNGFASGGDGVQKGDTKTNANNSSSSTPLCSVIHQGSTEADEGDGWLPYDDQHDDDDVEAQTWIVQELCDGGALDTAVRNGRISNMEQVLACLLDIARGLEYLHTRGLLHGDLKTANICLVNTSAPQAVAVAAAAASSSAAASWAGSSPGSSRRGSGSSTAGVDFVCKVMDFSLSKTLDAGMTHCSTHSLGTITHMAPELLSTGRQSKAADIYSYGMLVWEVLNKCKAPYPRLHSVEIVQRIVQQQMRPSWDAHADLHLVALAEQCWAAESSQRPPIRDICNRLMQLQRALQLQKQPAPSAACVPYSDAAVAAAAAALAIHQQQQGQQVPGRSAFARSLPDVLQPLQMLANGSNLSYLALQDGSFDEAERSSDTSSGSQKATRNAVIDQVPADGVDQHPLQSEVGSFSVMAQSRVALPAAGMECCQVPGAADLSATESKAGSLSGTPKCLRKRSFSFSCDKRPSIDLQSVNGSVHQNLFNFSLTAVPDQRECVHASQDGQAALAMVGHQDQAELPVFRPDGQAELMPARPEDQAGLEAVNPEGETDVAAVSLPEEARLAAVGPDDQAELAAVRPDDQAGLTTVRPEDQAGTMAFKTGMPASRSFAGSEDQPAVASGPIRSGDQAADDADRDADQAGLDAVTGVWKMRRHSHGSVGTALRAAAAAAAMTGMNGVSSAVAAAPANGATDNSATPSLIDSSGLQVWEGLLVTGRKGHIRGVDCSALDDESSGITGRQQLPLQQRSQSLASIDAQCNAAAVGASTGAAVPMVGYWD